MSNDPVVQQIEDLIEVFEEPHLLQETDERTAVIRRLDEVLKNLLWGSKEQRKGRKHDVLDDE